MASTALEPRRERDPIDALKNQLTRRADEFRMVLPQHITPEKFQRVVATAAIQNPQLLHCDRQSFLLAAMKLAQDGLIPDGREAALVPFKTWSRQSGEIWQVQPMPMVYGLRKKILQSGEVISIETGVVYHADLESGHFLYEVGLEPPIRYRPNLLLSIEETTDDKIVAAYSIAKLKNEFGGDPYWSVEVMRRAEIDQVRQSSQTGALGKKKRDGTPIQPKGPWVDWFGEMARKTVLRRHSKVLPMSGDVLQAIERDMESERAADSAAAYLATEPTGPVTLPGRGELSDDDQDNQPSHDPETGEVAEQRDSRGMTEVDEETARALDAGNEANDGTLDEDNPSAAEGRTDEQHGEEQQEPISDDAGKDPYRGAPWAERRREILDGFNLAETPRDVARTDETLVRHMAGFPDAVQAELEKAAAAARKKFPSKPKQAEKAQQDG
jgi:recombination protein RecT